MSDELWMFVDEEVQESLRDKYKNKIKSIKSPSEYKKGVDYDYTKLFWWADPDRKEQDEEYEHAYEAPWKTGWANFIINGRKVRVRWITIKGDLKVFAKIPKIKKRKK